MKKTSLLVLLLLIAFGLHAQVVVKLYQNLDCVINKTAEEYNQVTGTEADFHFSRTSLAIQFPSKKNLFHEFELNFSKRSLPIVHIEYPESEFIENEKRYIGFQYELNYRFQSASAFTFSLGGGIHAYHTEYLHHPTIGSIYAHSQLYTGGTLILIPRLQYAISKKIIADVNVKFPLLDCQWVEFNLNNPQLPIAEQVQQSFETKFFQQAYTIRFGIGYQF